jgi:hypothetical protein
VPGNGAAAGDEPVPVAAGDSGFDRLVALLSEVEQSRSRETERSA